MISDAIVVAFITGAFVAVGWYVTHKSQLKYEKAKRLGEYRLETLHTMVEIWLHIEKEGDRSFSDSAFISEIEKARVAVQLYGYPDEHTSMEEFIHCLNQKNVPGVNSSLKKLVSLTKNRIRRELGLEPLE